MPLFVDHLPFHRWTDASRPTPRHTWTVVLPLLLSEPSLHPSPAAPVFDWCLDTGHRGEGKVWRHHLATSGIDPDVNQFSFPYVIRTTTGQTTLRVRQADVWLVSNIPSLQASPYRIPLHLGLPFFDQPIIPDPEFHRPLIGMRALRTAGLRVELDFANDVVSVWTP